MHPAVVPVVLALGSLALVSSGCAAPQETFPFQPSRKISDEVPVERAVADLERLLAKARVYDRGAGKVATRLLVERVDERGFRVIGAGITRSYRHLDIDPHVVTLGASKSLERWIYICLTGPIDEDTTIAWDARTDVILFRKNREEKDVEALLDALASLAANARQRALDRVDLGPPEDEDE